MWYRIDEGMHERNNAAMSTKEAQAVEERRTAADNYNIRAAQRVLQALDLFVTQNAAIGVTELQQALGINSNMAFRILHTLENARYIVLSPETGKYHLSLKVLALGKAATASLTIAKVASPHLKLLSAELKKVNVIMFVYEHGDLIIAEKIDSKRLPKVYAHVGRLMPLHATAAGKMLASSLDEAELDAVVARTGLDSYTPTTVTDMEAFKQELAQIRNTQLAWEKEEHIQNLNGVAAAIRDKNGKVVAAVCINGFTNNVTLAELEQMTHTLLDFTYNISDTMMHMGGRVY